MVGAVTHVHTWGLSGEFDVSFILSPTTCARSLHCMASNPGPNVIPLLPLRLVGNKIEPAGPAILHGHWFTVRSVQTTVEQCPGQDPRWFSSAGVEL